MNFFDLVSQTLYRVETEDSLRRAFEKRDENAILSILNNGEKIDYDYILSNSSMCGLVNVVKVILEKKRFNKDNLSTLEFACRSKNEEIVKLLLDAGFSANNKYALQFASEKKIKPIVKLLLERGCEPTEEIISGSIYSGSIDISILLLQKFKGVFGKKVSN